MPGERVLIVDANGEARAQLVTQVLQPAGYAPIEAATLNEARAKIATVKPQLAVLTIDDIGSAMAFLAEHESSFPVVVLTVRRSADTIQALSEAGAYRILFMPYDPNRLAAMIARGLHMMKAVREYDALREQTERQAQEFNALYTVGKKITALLDTDEILGLVVTAAVNLTRAEEGTLMLLDSGTGELYLRASRNWADATARKQRVKVTDTLMGRVITSGRPIVMSGSELVKIQSSFLVKAIAGVPLSVGSRVTGVLSVDNNRTGRQFAEHDVHVLSTLADSAAIAIETAQLYQDAHRRAGELAALLEIDRHISSTLELPVVLERIATHARELLKSDDSEVYMLEPDGQTLRAIVAMGRYADAIKAHPLMLGQGIVGYVAHSRVAELVNYSERDPRSVRIPDTPEEHEALMCAPLISKGQMLGVMAVVRSGDRPLFQQSDLDFLKGLSGQAAIAIENARMYATERQRTIELARALEQQRELDRMKNEFIQNISHELRTPLAIVRGYAELLDSGELGELPRNQRESVNVMARRSRMLSKMLDDLLAILAAETHKMAMEPVDLAQLLETMLVDFQAVAKQSDIALTADIAAELPPVAGDQVHLRRVFDNLLGNALKFTPAGGTVTVRLLPVDANLVLEVADTGIGIPADKLGRIFDRFYQVDGSTTRRYSGVGLGLALVKEIVESHGGQVMVESQPGKGSMFRVTLPVMKDDTLTG